MFKFNSFCAECFDPYKIVWKSKKYSQDKEWIYLCGNCVRYYKALNRNNFKSQFENVKRSIRCSLMPTKLVLPFYDVN